MKKALFLFQLIFCFSAVNAQTYYYPNPPVGTVVNSCDSVALQLTGYFNDACSYFKLSDNATQISGSDIYCHITARNNGCDSGWICLMVLVPVNGVYNFPPINATGNYTLSLVVHNICMGVDNKDTVPVGNYNLSAFAANSTLTSNAGANIYLGMPVNYQINTNVPFNYTAYWYRNNVLANTTINTTQWSTTIQTISDTVRVKIESDTLCITDSAKWTNNLILNVNPNDVSDVNTKNSAIYYARNENRVYVSGISHGEKFEIYSIAGTVVSKGTFNSSNSTYIQLSELPAGIYILKLYQKAGLKYFKF